MINNDTSADLMIKTSLPSYQTKKLKIMNIKKLNDFPMIYLVCGANKSLKEVIKFMRV